MGYNNKIVIIAKKDKIDKMISSIESENKDAPHIVNDVKKLFSKANVYIDEGKNDVKYVWKNIRWIGTSYAVMAIINSLFELNTNSFLYERSEGRFKQFIKMGNYENHAFR